jgi:hypothetical protein
MFRRRVRSLALLVLAGGSLAAQSGSGSPAERLPLSAGNWWVFGAASGERFEIRATEERASRDGSRLVRLDDSNGDYRVLTVGPDVGVSLVELHRLGQAPVTFEPPLVLLPAGARAGSSHQHESALRAFDPSGDSEPQEGSARARVSFGRIEAVRSPAGQFADCLPVDAEIELSWREGAPGADTLRMWLAPGVGPVRVITGGDARPELDLRLLEARVGERSWPAEGR